MQFFKKIKTFKTIVTATSTTCTYTIIKGKVVTLGR